MAEQLPNPTDLLIPVDARISPDELGLDLPSPKFFPSPVATTPDGLLCLGGSLDPEWLLDAYRHGIFPWPLWDDEPMAWWCPDPRAILELDALYVSRRLARTIKSGKFTPSCDRNFAGVIHGCGTAPGRRGSTWLTPKMIAAYCEIHHLGHAHSVEVWQDGQLAGGVYGIAIGGFFAAESMFHLVRDASKVALYVLVEHLRSRGFQLLDIQQWTPHTGRLGAAEIARGQYLHRLEESIHLPVTFGDTLEPTQNSR